MGSGDVIEVLDRLDAAGIGWLVSGRDQVAHTRGRDAEARRSRMQHP